MRGHDRQVPYPHHKSLFLVSLEQTVSDPKGRCGGKNSGQIVKPVFVQDRT